MIFALAASLIGLGFSSQPEPDDTLPFAHGEVRVRAGAVLPLGSLARRHDPSPSIGATLAMSHWNSVRTRIDLDFSPLDGAGGRTRFGLGSAGFEWRPPALALEAGAGLALFYVRTRPDSAHPRLEESGESEFGCVVRGAWRLFEHGGWTARIEGAWEEAFTSPAASAFVRAGISLSRRAW